MLDRLESYVNRSKELLSFKFIMRVIGAYGIIQVFAQDVGVKTGCAQARIIHNAYMQFLIFTCAAYAVTDDFIQAFLGTLLYFIMRNVVSYGKTNNVCFPSQSEIAKCGKTD